MSKQSEEGKASECTCKTFGEISKCNISCDRDGPAKEPDPERRKEQQASVDVLEVGEIIVADIIGEGFYRIHSFGECFVNVECLKLFGKGFLHRGHITNCHNTPEPIDLKKWLSYRRVSLINTQTKKQ